MSLRAGFLALLLCCAALPAAASTLRRELGPAEPLAELVLRGENRAAAPRLVVLRVDDRAGPSYADRANVERLVPPGPFVLRWRLALLETPRGRLLDTTALRQAIAFAPQGAEVALATLGLESPPALPEGVLGWSFAPPGAAPLAGMEAVALDDPRLSGPTPRFVRRNGEDPILARGMARVTRFVAPLPPGRWRIALWTEDPGAWETLPPLLEHRVRANGRDIHVIRRDAAGWIAERYFAGRDGEPGAAAMPFDAIGARRGGRIEAEVEVTGQGLVLELAGHPHAATHIAALLAEPAAAPPRAVAALEGMRAARFAETWPVLARPAPIATPALRLDAPEPQVAAQGGLAILRFTAAGPTAGPARATLAWQGAALPARLTWAQWRWRRPAPETPGLVLEPIHWRGDMDALTLPAGLPRPLAVLVRIPAEATPGPRRLRLTLEAAGRRVTAEAVLDVLPLARPAPAARVGAFLDVAPHLASFPAFREQVRAQTRCDLDALAAIGLDAVAPPLTTPDAAGREAFLGDLREAAARFAPPLPAYAPLRRLARAEGPEAAAALAAEAARAATAAGLPPVAWVVADEPSGGGGIEAARRLAGAMRAAAPGALLAAHLNDPRDAALLPLLDLATVNHRFGADAADIARLRTAGVAPWLYNMPRLRLAAGFYLWRSGADGLLQWHARMPTADAFDPTDGREGDMQFLWPTPGVCDAPDLDADLLALAEGAEDLRWLAWLEASPAPEAASLLARLRRAIPDRWQDAAALPPATEAAWRAEITTLARRLTAPPPPAQSRRPQPR
jgi:hypothetical protein